MRQHPISPVRPRLPIWLAALVGAAWVALMAWMHLRITEPIITAIGFGVPIVVIAWFRNRWVLWTAAIAFALITSIEYFILRPRAPEPHVRADVFSGLLLLLDLLVVTS